MPVALESVRGWIKEGRQVIFLDAETPDVWVREKDGSRRVAPEEVPPFLRGLPREALLVTYSRRDPARARLLAGTLTQHGFKRVQELSADDWRALDVASARRGKDPVFPSVW